MARKSIGINLDDNDMNSLEHNFKELYQARNMTEDLNKRADSILTSSKNINSQNIDVQNQIDNLILSAGESDAEVIQARGSYSILNDRLSSVDANLAQIAINVKSFGVKGDGSTDDTANVMNGINSLLPEQKLFFPDGEYNLQSWTGLMLEKPVNIVGQSVEGVKIIGNSEDFLSTTNSINVEHVTFQDFGRLFRWDGIVKGEKIKINNIRVRNSGNVLSSPEEGGGLDNLIFTSNDIDLNFKGHGVIWQQGVKNVWIEKNLFKNVHTRAVHIGNNKAVPISTWNKIHINNNNIENVTSDSAGSPYGIIVYGNVVNISDNFIENVYMSGETSGDCEGIYTKCRNLIVSNNILVNAGRTEGSIVVKTPRTEGESFPERLLGRQKIISNNIIDHYEVGTVGITVASSDTALLNNRINGCRDGIIVSGSDFDTVEIRGNKLTNISRDGIVAWLNGDGFIVKDNTFDNINRHCIYNDSISSNVKDTIKGWIIGGNHFSRGRNGLYMRLRSGENRQQFEVLSIFNNYFENNEYGIVFESDEGITTEGLSIHNNRFKDGLSGIRQGTSYFGGVTECSLIGNTGINTLNQGVATVSPTSTGANVQHGLDFTPKYSDINVVQSWPGNTAVPFKVSGIGPNTFRIALNNVPNEELTFSWRAEINDISE